MESRRLTVETLSSFISERRISGMKSKKTFQMLSENLKAIFILKCFREFIPISLQCHIIYLTVIFKDEPKGRHQSSEGECVCNHSDEQVMLPNLLSSKLANLPTSLLTLTATASVNFRYVSGPNVLCGI